MVPPELWDLIKSYGPAALRLARMAPGYFSERADRKRPAARRGGPGGNQVAAEMGRTFATIKQSEPEGA
jgi:hypothetical protein